MKQDQTIQPVPAPTPELWTDGTFFKLQFPGEPIPVWPVTRNGKGEIVSMPLWRPATTEEEERWGGGY